MKNLDPRKDLRNPDCSLCTLRDHAETICMMGNGALPSKIMVIGEAPGAQEDNEGTPFVGASGQLLDSMLADVGIDRHEDCYVTNVAKCRPPDNDPPKRADIKTCVSAYLGEELALVKPEFILLLGNSALQGVVGKSGITKHRGSIWEAKGAQIFATFHPAAVLRNPRYRGMVLSDLQRFGRLVRGEESPALKTKVHYITTKKALSVLVDLIVNAEHNSYDIETYNDHPVGTAFQEYRGHHSKQVCIAFTFEPGVSYAIPLWHERTPWKDPGAVESILGKAIARSKAKNIAHNGKFDARWMQAKGMPIRQTFDTMLAAHMIDENRVKGLKPLSQMLLGADAYDVGDDLADAYHMDLKRLLTYNAKDTDYTLRLYHHMRKELLEEPRVAKVFQKLMMPASNALVEIEGHGIQLDMERWEERFRRCQRNAEKLRQYMLQWVPADKRDTFNFASPKQVGEWLFVDLGLPIIEETKTGNPSTKESVLLILGKTHKAVAAMLKWRKWTKYMNTYLLPWRDLRDGDDRIHPTYKLFGTVTGRLSCGDPNLQQVPRDPFIRGIVGAKPGWSLVVADYSQVELRIAAMMSQDSNMLVAFAQDKDLHLITALNTLSEGERHALAMLLHLRGMVRASESSSALLRGLSQGSKEKSPKETAAPKRSKGGSGKWGGSERSLESLLERGDFAPLLSSSPEGFLRAVRGFEQWWADIGRTSSGCKQLQQRSHELGNPLSFLSSQGTQLTESFPAWKEVRKRAKATNFGFLYGMGAPKFISYALDNYDAHVTLEEAEETRDAFFRTYPGLLTWHEKQRNLARKYHRVSNPIGRVRHLPDINSADRGVQGESERQAINSPVQSFASDLMLIALLELHRMMPVDEAFIVGTVHDSILCEIRNDLLDNWTPKIKATMEDMSIVKRMFGTEVTVPIVADIDVGSHWA